MPASLSAALSLAGAEEQPVGELWRYTVQEHPQCLVAALLAAGLPFVGVFLAAGSDEGGALPLAVAIKIACFDCIEAGVAVSLSIWAVETFWGHCVHP